MSNKSDPCKKFACALQSCLQANDFQEWKCQPVIEALYDCCAKCGKDQSAVCSGIKAKESKGGRSSPLKFRHAAIRVDEHDILPTVLEPPDSATTDDAAETNADASPA